MRCFTAGSFRTFYVAYHVITRFQIFFLATFASFHLANPARVETDALEEGPFQKRVAKLAPPGAFAAQGASEATGWVRVSRGRGVLASGEDAVLRTKERTVVADDGGCLVTRAGGKARIQRGAPATASSERRLR